MNDLTSGQNQAIEQALAENAEKPGALLPILHAIQDRLGYVPQLAIEKIAIALNLSKAEVHGTISFYHYFKTKPPGKHTVYICRAEACQAMSSRKLEEHAKKALQADYHETDASGEYTLEPVYCLGNCACSPSLMVDTTLYSRVTPERFDEIIDSYKTEV